MRKIFFVFFALLCCLCLSVYSFASDVQTEGQEQTELEAYITDKIMPVVVGVLTSAVALFTTLAGIAKSLKGLKDTKSTFEGEARDRADAFKNNTSLLESKISEIKSTVENVPELGAQLEELQSQVVVLVDECRLLAEILSLGFSANSEIIKTGKGKKMAVLLENAKSKVTEGQNEKD